MKGQESFPPVTPERIMQFAWGYSIPLMLEAAIEIGLFDQLAGGPKSIDEIVQLTGASRRGVLAIANALVGINLLGKKGDKYELAPESAAFLVKERPGYLGGFFSHITTMLMPSWMKLTQIVRSGAPAISANSQSEGAEFFEKFVEALFPLSYAAAKRLAEELKLAQAESPMKVLDLAAGSGVWGIALAQASPHVEVFAVDWPNVLGVTKRMAARHGVEKQLRTIEGDLLEVSFGGHYRVATLGHILHSEGVERSKKLLKKTADALASGGTIAIQEFLVNADRTGPVNGLIFAVNMLVNTQKGDTFSFEEIGEWLKEAGFVNPRLLEAPGPSPLILAEKA